METVAAMGCWSDMKTLQHYVGAEALVEKVMMELRQKDSSRCLGDLMQELLEKMGQWKAESAPLAGAPREKTGLGIVMLRKPYRWHMPREAVGHLNTWRTCCGESFNPASMTIQLISSKLSTSPWCSKC